jgi:hypothetical protein
MSASRKSARLLVAAEREHLLELIDDKHRALAALRQSPLQRGQRMCAGAHHNRAPRLGSRQDAAGERRQ